MESRKPILQELQEISPVVAGLEAINLYQVPAGYFDALPSLILGRVKATAATSPLEELQAISPLLSRLNKQLPYSAPASYFEELSDIAMAGAKAIEFVNEELENTPQVLDQLRNKTVYEVPQGYFEQLPEAILKKIKAAETAPAKIIPIRSNRRWRLYAAAAVVTGIMAFAGWLFIRPGSNDKATIPATQLANIEKVSDDELQLYLDSQLAPADETGLVNTATGELDMKEMLAYISDEELQQYLDNNTNRKLLTN